MMREEDLIRIAQKLDKMVSGNNTEGALDLLTELKSFNMTLKLLQETRIGMSVNGIRKHCTDDEVVALAKILIKDWKRLLDTQSPTEIKNGVESTGSPGHAPSEGQPRKDSSDSKPRLPKRPSVDGKKDRERKDSTDSKPVLYRKDSTDSKPVSPAKRRNSESRPDRKEASDSRNESSDSKKDGSPPPKKLSGERRESCGSKPSHPGPVQRKASTDGAERRGKLDTPKSPTTPTSPMSPSFSSAGGPLSPRLATGDSIRDKCIEMLAAALRTDDNYKEFGTNCDTMASEMEDYIYQENRATDMKYKNRVRSRISNLKDPKNPGLRRNVLAGGIELSRFATMTAEEMASDELKQLRNVMTQEAIREHQMAKTGGTTTDLLQCGKCKKKNCTYNQVQTRSADEPMTTFCLCNECGNRWKFC